MNQIYYIGQYSAINNTRNLRIHPSAITKMNYIISALKKANFKVHIFSPAETCNAFFCRFSKEQRAVDDFETITYINTIGGPSLLLKVISRFWAMLQLCFFLLFEVGKNDNILVYHGLLYKWPIKIALLFKKLNLYFEVEELYHAVKASSLKKIKKEIKYLREAKGYILVNDLIAEKCGFVNKPIAVCYGDYRMNYIEKSSFWDENIHLVYAGLIDGSGSDVYLALETMFYLPSNYRLHILGYGVSKNINLLKKRIDELNYSAGFESIIYHGCLSGNEYFTFLSKCDIGLCTRVLIDEYSDYTFPSKVLVYLGNNLIPICSPISSVVHSQISESVVFTKDIAPNSVANSVLSIQFNQTHISENILNSLDDQFAKNLKQLFNRI